MAPQQQQQRGGAAAAARPLRRRRLAAAAAVAVALLACVAQPADALSFELPATSIADPSARRWYDDVDRRAWDRNGGAELMRHGRANLSLCGRT